MYSEGAGVTKDDVKATKWLRKAAEQGHREAQANLDVMYASDIRAPQSNQVYDYRTPSTSSSSSSSSSSSYSSSYQPRVSGEDLTKISTGVYNYARQQQMVDVSGYTRGNTYVQPHQRQPQGGIDNFEAGALALGAAVAIVGIDYASQKYDQWSAEREVAARRKAEELARKEQQELLAQREAEREKDKKKSWWSVDKKEEEPENPWAIFEKKSWWE